MANIMKTSRYDPIIPKQDLVIGEYYAGGRIDIRNDSKEGYDGWDEYALAPMHGTDWNALTDYLDDLETETLLDYDELISQFETYYSKSIRWAE